MFNKRTVIIGAVALTAACAPRAYRNVVEFEYYSLAVGPNPNLNKIQLPYGKETSAVSWALVQAVQGLGMSIVHPDVSIRPEIPQTEKWYTDTVTVTSSQLQLYNARHFTHSLQNDRIYGIAYTGRYSIARRELSISVTPILLNRGSASAFRTYAGEYDGRFFVAEVIDSLKQQLLDSKGLQ
jgi:hypothetical protein